VKSSLARRTLRTTLAIGAAAGFVLAAAPAANAAPVQPTHPPSHPGVILAATGSDTTESMMNEILNPKLGCVAGGGGNVGDPNAVNCTPALTGNYNIPAVPGAGGFTVPSDASCANAVVWQSTGSTQAPTSPSKAPNGSGSGRDELIRESETAAGGPYGCVDIARSSGPPRSGVDGTTNNTQFFAYALDSVTWASPSLNAPSKLTLQQLRDIYACKYNDWGQLGGTPGPIQRLLPQTSSGTGQVFKQYLLGLSGVSGSGPAASNTTAFPLVGTSAVDGSNLTCPAAKDYAYGSAPGANDLEENQGVTLAPDDYQSAIMAYSAGKWSYQSSHPTNPTLDRRNGVRVGALSQATGVTTPTYAVKWTGGSTGLFSLNNAPNVVDDSNAVGVGNDATVTYPGVRYLWNILDTSSPNYVQAKDTVGFVNTGAGAKSPLCSGADLDIIQSYGFLDLPAGEPNTVNTTSTCRKFGKATPA